MNADPRVQELLALVHEEGIRLPMPPDMIVYFENQDKVVCLVTGKVYDAVTVQPTPSAQAVAHLLQDAVGAVVL
jgi:hypothetical protein